jgi:hypothetical protein
MQKNTPITVKSDNHFHILLFAGDKKISDMLVFLMYRKLKQLTSQEVEEKARQLNQKTGD